MDCTLRFFLLVTSFLLLLPITSIASSPDPADNFLVISDIHLDKTSTHLMEISPTNEKEENDLDPVTFKKLISQLTDNISHGVVKYPKFIIILGDIVGHVRTSPDSAMEDEILVFKTLTEAFKDIPIFYTVGNNDSLKINYGPFTDDSRKGPVKNAYDVAKIYAGWGNGFLSSGTICEKQAGKFPCIIAENTKSGFYAAYLQPTFRLISLNTVLFSPNRTQVTAADALNQLQWLKEQLISARVNHESVLITMHIPPGNNVYDHSNFWLSEEQEIFLKLIGEYSNNIVGILASHTHADELKIIKNEFKRNIAGVYFTAGLSTSHGNEPSVKTFYFFRTIYEKFQITDYETFHFSMKDHLYFSKLYDFYNYYCDDLVNDFCLNGITAEKMKKYFSAGNLNFTGNINFPEDINIIYS